MKSYTDIEQCKKLAEILPIESADMGWNVFVDDSTRCLPIDDWDLSKNGEGGAKFIPCWSLTALLDVIPNVSLNAFKDGNWNVMVEHDGKMIYANKDNPINACFELILLLHEQKLL